MEKIDFYRELAFNERKLRWSAEMTLEKASQAVKQSSPSEELIVQLQKTEVKRFKKRFRRQHVLKPMSGNLRSCLS